MAEEADGGDNGSGVKILVDTDTPLVALWRT